MIDEIGKFLEEYGWRHMEFTGEVNKKKYVVTYLSPNYDTTLRIPILIQGDEKWLYTSTHKLFKYPKGSEVVIRFLKFNSQVPLVKWFSREVQDEMYINIGFEIHKDEFSKEYFFKLMDALGFYVDNTMKLLKEHNELNEDNLTRMKEFTKDSLETY